MNAGSVKTLAHADLVFFFKCYLASRFKKHPGHSPSMGQTGKKGGGGEKCDHFTFGPGNSRSL